MTDSLPSILPPFDPSDEFSCPFGELGLCDDPTHLSCEQISPLPYTTSPTSMQNYPAISDLYIPTSQNYAPNLAPVKLEDVLPISNKEIPPTPLSFTLSTPALSPESSSNASSPSYLDNTLFEPQTQRRPSTTQDEQYNTAYHHQPQTQPQPQSQTIHPKKLSPHDSRTAHSRVEKKYRNSINGGIARLEKAIPHLAFYSKDNDKRPTKSTVLAAAYDHITNLEQEKARLSAELATLRQAVRMLRGKR